MISQILRKAAASIFLVGAFRKYQNTVSLMRIKVAQTYVLSIKKIRILLLGILLLALSLILFTNGLTLLQTAIFTYSSLSPEEKFTAALILGAVEVLLSLGVFIYLIQEETWSKFAEISKVVNAVLDDQGKKS